MSARVQLLNGDGSYSSAVKLRKNCKWRGCAFVCADAAIAIVVDTALATATVPDAPTNIASIVVAAAYVAAAAADTTPIVCVRVCVRAEAPWDQLNSKA